jgi:hypothetical protein
MCPLYVPQMGSHSAKLAIQLSRIHLLFPYMSSEFLIVYLIN